MSFYSAIYQEDLSARAKLVYMYLKDRASKEGQCWPAIQTIGKDLGLLRRIRKKEAGKNHSTMPIPSFLLFVGVIY